MATLSPTLSVTTPLLTRCRSTRRVCFSQEVGSFSALSNPPADNGTITMWDYASGLPFQNLKDIPQPGSLDAEAVSLI